MKNIILIASLLISVLAFAQIDQAKLNKIYNLGQRLQLEGKHNESLARFLKVVELDPNDWQARAKVIQEYQAVGNIKKRDLERKELIKLHKKGEIGQLNAKPFYCRDQFFAGINKVMTLEFFKLEGDYAVRYSFIVFDKKGEKTQFKVTLGSYAATNIIARQVGELKEEGQRLFHLDGYFPDGEHRTYAFFIGEPMYDDIRKLVVEIVEGKRKNISGTKPIKKVQN